LRRGSIFKTASGGPQELELDQEDPIARPVLGGFQQIHDAGESGAAREFGRDVLEGDFPD